MVLALAGAIAVGCHGKGGEAPPEAGPAPSATGPKGPGASEQAVIVRVHYPSLDFAPLHAVEDRLREAIAHAGVGTLDGDDITPGVDAVIYAYGPDADRLYAAMRPVLEGEPLTHGAIATLRYGIWHEGMRETQLTVGAER
ncbi:MAG TPA: hypothetical protein VIF09_22305 [Polyangiaceae bacterium]|jgi:hypothetical protein